MPCNLPRRVALLLNRVFNASSKQDHILPTYSRFVTYSLETRKNTSSKLHRMIRSSQLVSKSQQCPVEPCSCVPEAPNRPEKVLFTYFRPLGPKVGMIYRTGSLCSQCNHSESNLLGEAGRVLMFRDRHCTGGCP